MRKVVTKTRYAYRYASIILALSVFVFTGCAVQTPKGNLPTDSTSSSQEASQSKILRAAKKKKYYKKRPTPIEQSIITKIEKSYKKWKGTKYRYGGMSNRGIDCSALTLKMYREVFGRALPRTTNAQLHTGSKVDKKDLNPGDLIFFKINGRISHVGLYVFNGEFIHSSTSRGVMKSNLSNPYWLAHYYGSRTHWR